MFLLCGRGGGFWGIAHLLRIGSKNVLLVTGQVSCVVLR